MSTSADLTRATGLGAEGVNIAGYFRSENGLGEAGRLLVAAADAASIEYKTLTYAAPHSRQEHQFVDRGTGKPLYDVNIACVNAEQMPGFAAAIGPAFFADRYTIGTWFWETEEFPARLWSAFDFVDEVWMPSDFSRDGLAAVTDKPVVTVPPAVIAPEIDPGLGRDALGLPGGYLFLFAFDFLSTARRKNAVGVIEAFKKAFRPGEGASLVIKSANGDKRPEDLAELLAAASGRPDIKVIDEYVTAKRSDAFIAACDCYVSLHRSEGFGLGMAVAMSLGKPVIATRYSGNLVFMTEENSYLVDWSRTVVGPGCPIYSAEAHWADPDLEDAARLMRQVFENQAEGSARGARASDDIARDHSVGARAALIDSRLKEIWRQRPSVDHVWGERWEYARPTQRAAVYVAGGTDTNLPTRKGGIYGSVARLGRKTMQRLLLNHEVHQEEVEKSLLDAIRLLEARVKGLEDELRPKD